MDRNCLGCGCVFDDTYSGAESYKDFCSQDCEE